MHRHNKRIVSTRGNNPFYYVTIELLEHVTKSDSPSSRFGFVQVYNITKTYFRSRTKTPTILHSKVDMLYNFDTDT